MTNIIISSYFNPIHLGHIEYIKEAAKLGDVRAIVNNDKQVTKKGSIPFLDEKTRLEIISNFGLVKSAHLSIDKDKYVAKTIELIYNKMPKPYSKWIFFNMGDVSEIPVREAEICNKLGIKIVCSPSKKINSSSKIIENAAREWVKRELKL